MSARYVMKSDTWGTLSPTPPGIYRFMGCLIMIKKSPLEHGAHYQYSHLHGTRVASQRCPIPHAGTYGVLYFIKRLKLIIHKEVIKFSIL
jgi:hypothetical protein